MKGSFGLSSDANAEFKWSLATWELGMIGTISNAYCTVAKNEVLSDVTDTFNVTQPPANLAPVWTANFPPSLTLSVGQTYNFAQHAFDPDGSTLTFTKVSGNGTVSTSGVYTAGTSGGPVVIAASDGVASTNSPSVTVTVTGAPLIAPIVVNGEYWDIPAAYPQTKSPYGGNYQIWQTLPRKGDGTLGDAVDYYRIGGDWKDIETADGVYDWSRIEDISTANLTGLKEIAAAGKKAIVWLAWRRINVPRRFMDD
jgi:hypothetical protein